MKKIIIGLLVTILFVMCLFQLYKYSVKKDIEDYLVKKYTGKTFNAEIVRHQIRGSMLTAKISCSDGTNFTLYRQSGNTTDNYLAVKYNNMITEDIKEVLDRNGLLKYVKTIDISILGNLSYLGDTTVNYFLRIEYNEYIKNNNEFAEVAYKIINSAKKFNNTSVYLFVQDRRGQTFTLMIYTDEGVKTPKEILGKIIIGT